MAVMRIRGLPAGARPRWIVRLDIALYRRLSRQGTALLDAVDAARDALMCGRERRYGSATTPAPPGSLGSKPNQPIGSPVTGRVSEPAIRLGLPDNELRRQPIVGLRRNHRLHLLESQATSARCRPRVTNPRCLSRPLVFARSTHRRGH